jgi:hypothetical protein
MSGKLFASRPTCISIRFAACLLIFSMLVVSVPAASSEIVSRAASTWQSFRFAVLSSAFADDPGKFLFTYLHEGRATARAGAVAQIRIFPGALNVRQGQETALTGVAYDADGEPLSGIAFQWSVTDVGRSSPARPLLNSTFRARIPGTFLIRASGGGVQAEVQGGVD